MTENTNQTPPADDAGAAGQDQATRMQNAVLDAVRKIGLEPKVLDDGTVTFKTGEQIVAVRGYPTPPTGLRIFVEYPFEAFNVSRERASELVNQIGAVLRTIKVSLVKDIVVISSDTFVLREEDVAPLMVLGMEAVVAGGTLFRDLTLAENGITVGNATPSPEAAALGERLDEGTRGSAES